MDQSFFVALQELILPLLRTEIWFVNFRDLGKTLHLSVSWPDMLREVNPCAWRLHPKTVLVDRSPRNQEIIAAKKPVNQTNKCQVFRILTLTTSPDS